MTVQIICANKPSGNLHNPHEAIEDYGWVDENGQRGVSTRQDMVNWLKQAGNAAYVADRLGNRIQCYRRTSVHGVEFLQTYADGTYTDNLLNLPACAINR